MASKKGAEKQVLIAKGIGRKVRFEAVTPKASSKTKQKEFDSAAKLAAEALGLKDRKVSPSMAQAIINTNERVNSSIHATHKDVNFLREHLVSRHDSLNSDLNVSSESLDTGIESDFSGSTESLNSIASDMDSNFSGSIESLDSLDAEGQPIFGTFSFKRHSEQTGIEQKESQTRSELKRRNATRRDSIFPPELPPKRQKQTAPPRPFKPDHLRRPGLSSNRRDLPAPPAPQQESPSATVQQQPERKETGLLSLDSKAQVEPEKVLLLLERNGCSL